MGKIYKKIIAKKNSLQLRGNLVQWYPDIRSLPNEPIGTVRDFGNAGVLVCWKQG